MLTALIVDDSRFMRTFIEGILKIGGFQSLHASNGVEAVKVYKENQIDVVIMDIVMDEQNGIEALRQIREYDSDAKVVMCSSLSYKLLVLEAIKLGACDFVAKPFKAQQLFDTVNKVVKGNSKK